LFPTGVIPVPKPAPGRSKENSAAKVLPAATVVKAKVKI